MIWWRVVLEKMKFEMIVYDYYEECWEIEREILFCIYRYFNFIKIYYEVI